MKKKRIKRIVARPFELVFAYFLLFFLRISSFQRLQRMAAHLTSLYLFFSFKGKKITLANLKLCYPNLPDSEHQGLMKQSIKSAILTYLETAWLLKTPDQLTEYVSIDPELYAELKDAQCRGNGVILVTGQIGNWELGAIALSAYGIHLSVITRKIHNPFISKILNRSRSTLGAELILNDNAPKGCINALKQGKAVAIQLDHNTKPGHGGRFHSFFGLPVPVTRLPASLALRSGSSLKVIGCIRKGGKLEIVEQKLPDNWYNLDEQTLTEKLLEGLETLIKAYPEQWFWRYERWKYKPSTDQTELLKSYPFYAN